MNILKPLCLNHSCSCFTQKYPLLILLRFLLKNANFFGSRLLYSGSCTPKSRDGQNPESEYAVFLSALEWSRSLVSNFKIETKNDASVKCNFDVTIGFPNFEKFGVGV